MTRQKFGKIIIALIVTCMLGVGAIPAKAGCTAECCVKPKLHSQHDQANNAASAMSTGCCLGLKAAPCPYMVDSAPEMTEYVVSEGSGVEKPVAVRLAHLSGDNFLISSCDRHLTGPKGPPIRRPNVPLYLTNLSLLI
ncbi:MAG: hypothetical protein JSU72_10450 [Deltaproteobacteria bacterium]|nr:MAG: hypothetical protein JSU72_10450 [Deltaproteobacteria bacterium]